MISRIPVSSREKNTVIGNRSKYRFPSSLIRWEIPTPVRSPAGNDSVSSLLAEGLAVGALVCGGIGLVGAHQDPVQRAVICLLAMVLALLNSTLNALVCMTVHGIILLLFVMELECPHSEKTYISFRLTIDFFSGIQYNISGICEFSQICIMKGGNPVFEKKGILP